MLLVLFAAIAAITISLRSHATDVHGDHAIQARNCIKNSGVWKAYQEPKNPNIYHWLCQDPVTKTIYDMIVEKLDELTYKEKSAFKPKGGKWDPIRHLLELGPNRGGKWVNPPQGPLNLIGP
jgi:hypothetical protein